MTIEKDISKQPKYLRSHVSHGIDAVDREGGIWGAGMISGVAVLTRGEALGHELWIDQDFISDVTFAINNSKAMSGGVKARFTHPGLSSDGMATKLGRIINARTVGERVIAELHFAEFAHKTPEGDLAEYVMSLAEEDPDSFGLSIVFEMDEREMDKQTKHQTSGHPARYISPDQDNLNNYSHARLKKLRGADVVDDPAANPGGLFHREQEIAQEADSLMEYALGLSGEKPSCASLSVDADRVQSAVARFLSRHDLTLTKKGEEMSDDVTPVEVPEAEPQLSSEDVRKEFAAELSRFTEAFGATNAAEWVAEGISFTDAQSRHIGALNAKNDALQAKVGELQETLNSIDTGDTEPADFGEAEVKQSPQRAGLGRKIRISGKSYPEDN